MGRKVFDQARSILQQINEGSKPKKDFLCILVMMSTEYVTPTANLLHLLTHPKATTEDLDLFWELTDRLWCEAPHPIFKLHSGYLDQTCRKITRRCEEVKATSNEHVHWCLMTRATHAHFTGGWVPYHGEQ